MILRQTNTSNYPVIGWRNSVTPANIAATNVDANYPASNLANPSTHLKWKMATAGTDEFLSVTGISETLSYLGVAQHNFGDAGVTCTVQTAAAGPTWTTRVGPTLITDNKPLIFEFDPIACIGVRLRMQSAGTALVEAAVLTTGLLLTLERSVRIDQNHTPINLAPVSDIINGMSESGQFVGRIVQNQYQESKLDFWYFVNSFYRTEVDAFIINSVQKPFFVAWAPVTYPTDTGYCWLTKDPRPELHLPTDRFNVSFEMRGLA